MSTPKSTSVPIMITAAMERRLVELGVSAETIRQLKPDEAWTLLTRVNPVHPLGPPAAHEKAAALPPGPEQEE